VTLEVECLDRISLNAYVLTAKFVTTLQDNARVGRITNIGQITGDVHL
jgi:hypothetical protein